MLSSQCCHQDTVTNMFSSEMLSGCHTSLQDSLHMMQTDNRCIVVAAGIKFFQQVRVVDPDDETKVYHFDLEDSEHCACFNIGRHHAK